MTTLDDKLLGEKKHYYCSSSDEDDAEREPVTVAKEPKFTQVDKKFDKWEGAAKNTGPKGVIRDWQVYKQLEAKQTAESEAERKQLLQKLALTCNIDQDLQPKDDLKSKNELIEDDLQDDEFLKKYFQERIEEMKQRLIEKHKFGKLIELRNENFLNEIDNENLNVTIVIHVYDKRQECKLLNKYLESLAQEYDHVKFCKVQSIEISLSEKFRRFGCPAILVYKNKELIGNFVKLTEHIGDEFVLSDVENFLLEQNLLSTHVISSIKSNEKDLDDDDE